MDNIFKNFSDNARKSIQIASAEAKQLRCDRISTEHILLGIMKNTRSIVVAAMDSLEIRYDKVFSTIKSKYYDSIDEKKEKNSTNSTEIKYNQNNYNFTTNTINILKMSGEEASNCKSTYIGTEHIMLAIIRDPESIAYQVLISLNVSPEEIREAIMEFLSPTSIGIRDSITDKGDLLTLFSDFSELEKNDQDILEEPDHIPISPPIFSRNKGKSTTPALDVFGTDLTKKAREGKLDPLIGREIEVKRIITILARRRKNNPVLIGDAGVGKSAIVEGLATKIAENKVPQFLSKFRVVQLDIALMVAGTKYRGQFEERIKSVVQEITASKNIIVFIDELHTLVGSGSAEGTMDGANILKPALARGELQCIGATTLGEYRKSVEKDAALERRFQPILVNEPTIDEAILILNGLRPQYENFHRVKITDSALLESVRLSHRYITGRFLPDKAIDVLDESCAQVKVDNSEDPPEILEIQREMQKIAKDKEACISSHSFEKAASLRDRYEECENKLSKIREKTLDKNNICNVGEDIVYKTISSITNIPLEKMSMTEKDKLVKMEEIIGAKVIGQQDAVSSISKSIRRAKAGLKNPRRPIASFLFLGSTGIGKTLLAKILSEFLFNNQDSLIRLDMSEYMEKHSVSRLIGAPPGYIGHEEGGQLTEKVRRKPYSIILLDEIEKSHEDTFNILLQIMEEGQLTDGLGRVVDFRNCIIIMTSNIGSRVLKDTQSIGFGRQETRSTPEQIKNKIKQEVEQAFSPEFINRLSEIVYFRKLDKEDMKLIVAIEVEKVSLLLKEQNISLEVDSSAKEFLIEKGYNSEMGARPLNRVIEKYVTDAITDEIMANRVCNNSRVTISINDDKSKLVFCSNANNNIVPSSVSKKRRNIKSNKINRELNNT